VMPVTSETSLATVEKMKLICRREIMTLAAAGRHRLFPRIAIVLGGAGALTIALLTAGSGLSTTSDARTASTPTFSTFERVVEGPVTLPIVPSAVIDTSDQFFFGTGDGCAGYYAEQPAR
jgi:hypothetical protein